ncbi:hypothetical protein TNCV_2348091 [Trichonephila clavipes]|uniref:Uncharacterized protein n=1 Tax=Trichonephila clavipes TaxID=2585209 RepID=A0A8X6VPV0_TRICX|nr:hypothetical protein TNCV_2348091 [Trichonephila clavipes]
MFSKGDQWSLFKIEIVIVKMQQNVIKNYWKPVGKMHYRIRRVHGVHGGLASSLGLKKTEDFQRIGHSSCPQHQIDILVVSYP